MRCSLAQFLRDHRDLAKHAEALRALAVEQNFAYWAGLGTYFQGWAQAVAGDVAGGIAEMRRGLAACQTTGAQAYVPYNLALLADMYRSAGDTLQARKLLDDALHRLGQTDARYCEAELLCIDGELKLAMSPDDHDDAEATFRRAIELARKQQAKAVELRAAICLARRVGVSRQAARGARSAHADLWLVHGRLCDRLSRRGEAPARHARLSHPQAFHKRQWIMRIAA